MSSAIALTLTSLCLAGCGGLVDENLGGLDAPDSGVDFVACGGDVLGTWAISGASLIRSPTPSTNSCPGRVAIATRPVAGGWATFESDGTMTGAASVGNDQRYVIPLGCTDASDCHSLDIQSSSVSVSCEASVSSGCVCSTVLTLTLPPAMEMPYRVDGGSMFFGLNETPVSYCVRDGILSWEWTAPNSAFQGAGEVIVIHATR
jgi:hypothetical protein